MDKGGQVSIFVIVAIVLAAGVAIFFLVRGGFGVGGVAPEFTSAYEEYLSCVEQATREAVSLAGTQGGHLDSVEYVPGSQFAPFSSYFNFLGTPVPYWFYVTGNNLVKEQVPTKDQMEQEMGEYIAEALGECDLTAYAADGISITRGEAGASVNVGDSDVEVTVTEAMSFAKGDVRSSITRHEVSVASRLGSLYDSARTIYLAERDGAFLENYSVDALRYYAPVDGVEVSCSPKVWNSRDVISSFQQGLAANLGALKFRGDYYSVERDDGAYFVTNIPTEHPVRVLYSADWPQSFEITPSRGELLVAEPIGNQQGMGALGFCYIPYHFVYDARFPVLIQVYEGTEIFQFPVVVVIDNNVPREAELAELPQSEGSTETDICAFSENMLRVSTYDSSLAPVAGARVSYQCFDQTCDLGTTRLNAEGLAFLEAAVPACVNGQLVVEAENFTRASKIVSSNRESSAEVILEPLRRVRVDVDINGAPTDRALVYFEQAGMTATASLPEVPEVSLAAGLYNVSVYVYGNSSLTIPASTRQECFEVARSGVLGLFGRTREECVDVTIPATSLGYALVAGGKTEGVYMSDGELQSGRVMLSVPRLRTPSSLEDIQVNYELFEEQNVEVSFA